MLDLDREPARGACVEAAAQVAVRGGGEFGALLGGGGDPAAQPRGGQLPLAGAEPPRARPGLDGGAAPSERPRCGGDGVRAEEAVAALVRVERGGEVGVERVGRGQPDASDDRQRQQRRAGRGGGDRVDLGGGEHVQQRGRGDERRADQVGRVEVTDVALAGLDRRGQAVGAGVDVGAGLVEQGGVVVVQDPVLRAAQPSGQPASEGAGAAAEVPDGQGPVRWERGAERADQVPGACRGVGALPQRQP